MEAPRASEVRPADVGAGEVTAGDVAVAEARALQLAWTKEVCSRLAISKEALRASARSSVEKPFISARCSEALVRFA